MEGNLGVGYGTRAAGKYCDLFRGWWVNFQAAVSMWWGARRRRLKRLER